MKRIVGIATLAAAMLVASSALAVSNRQIGKVVGDSTAKVKLTVVKEGGIPVRVERLRLNNLTPQCKDGGDHKVSTLPTGEIEVFESDRSFRVRYELPQGGNRAVLKGKVSRNGRSVKGTFKTGFFPSSMTECRIEKLKYKTRQR